MVVVVQLVRTPDCGSGGRRFESGLPPRIKAVAKATAFFSSQGSSVGWNVPTLVGKVAGSNPVFHPE